MVLEHTFLQELCKKLSQRQSFKLTITTVFQWIQSPNLQGAVVATNPVLQTEQGAPIVTLQAETNPNPSQTNNIQPTENLQDPSPAQNINEPANPGPSGRLPQPVNPVANPGQSGQLPQPANPVAQPGQSGQLPRPTQPANL